MHFTKIKNEVRIMNNYLNDANYRSCNLQEKISGLIENAQCYLWTNKEHKSVFRAIINYRKGFKFGLHHGDCICAPQTCFCCAYYELLENFINLFPIFLRLEGGSNYEDILEKYYNLVHSDNRLRVGIKNNPERMDKSNLEFRFIQSYLKEHNIFEEYEKSMKENLNKIYE